MKILIIILVLFLLFSFMSKYEKDRRIQARRKMLLEKSLDANIREFSIKGINFRDLDDMMLGDFMGYVRALKSNPHDKYAIGVYVGNKKVGFLPRGNKELHEKIMANGGTAGAEGYITKGESEDGRLFYYGKVNVLGV